MEILAMAKGHQQLQKPLGQVRYKTLYYQKKEEMIAAGNTGDRIIPEAVVAEVNKALIPNARPNKPKPHHREVLTIATQESKKQHKAARFSEAWGAWRRAHNRPSFSDRRALEKEAFNKRREDRRAANMAMLEKQKEKKANEEKATQEQAE